MAAWKEVVIAIEWANKYKAASSEVDAEIQPKKVSCKLKKDAANDQKSRRNRSQVVKETIHLEKGTTHNIDIIVKAKTTQITVISCSSS